MRKRLISYTLPVLVVLIGCQPNKSTQQKNLGQNSVQAVINGAIANQIYIEGGTFIMGDFGATGNDGIWRPYFPPAFEKDKAHQVTLTSYSLLKYKTTWHEFDTYLAAENIPAVHEAFGDEWSREPFDQNSESRHYIKNPAQVTWQEAKNYCLWLGKHTDLAFDLPTSAQHEYAARNRGSKDWLYATHDGKAINTSSDPYGDVVYDNGSIGPVGTRLPANPLGLYDMAENAREWVNDWYSETYYSENPEIVDPQGPETGTEKVLRSLGLGSLTFSFTRNGVPERLENPVNEEHRLLVKAGFRCAVQSAEPVSQAVQN
ncbi:hypothetical protein LCGC14_0763010 [marine sediment metagenome]|uniref:Sulfatase-modifying factor enzyme-like domain-containing protein n=2 Tax=root TaxID=1 RepID=A0A831W1Q6_9GAMM|nr:SUMF1/EgtB/PvdO family nonheme iron enzyme [Marinobacter antarcticus]HEA51722.1 hypothetical protein [Marinobacter antarcticus]